MSNDQLPVVSGEHFAVPSSGAAAGAVAAAIHGEGAVTGASAGATTDAGVATYEGWARAVGVDPKSPIVARTREYLSKLTARSKEELTAQAMQERNAEQRAADQADKTQLIATMTKEWGQHSYERNVLAINTWLNTLPPAVAEGMRNASLDDGTLLANTPAGIRWMLQQATRRATPTGGGSSGGAGAELLELQHMLADKTSAYWKDEGLQLRYRELLAQGVTPARAHGGATAADGEIRELERMMGDRRSRYHRGPEAEALQQRYRDLITQRDALKGN